MVNGFLGCSGQDLGIGGSINGFDICCVFICFGQEMNGGVEFVVGLVESCCDGGGVGVGVDVLVLFY